MGWRVEHFRTRWRRGLWRSRAWRGRLIVGYFAVCLGVIGFVLYQTHPAVGARLAAMTRDPAMDLKGPFRNCTEAKAAGYANIPRGSPAYVRWQDRDGDGLACEPYAGGPGGGRIMWRLVRLRSLLR